MTEPYSGDIETLKVTIDTEDEGEQICCPSCQSEHFTLHRNKLSDRMLASARLDVTCIGCGYRESLYKIGDRVSE